MRRTVLAVLLSVGCANSGGAVASAVVNTALGAGVAAARRSNGECYTPCLPGTRCNEATGMCDPIPCRGECRPDEVCEQTPTGERCVLPPVELEIRTVGSPDAGLPRGAPRLKLPE